MARSRKEIGTCRLCLEYGDLSFEHVPPASAFNETVVRGHTMDEWVKNDGALGLGGKQSQRGMGAYTLCGRCNNKTGKWYGGEYVTWAKRALYLLDVVPSGAEVTFRVPAQFPLRFLKQVVTMFFSLNSVDVSAGNRELARFVLDRNSKSLPAHFNVFLALYKGPLARSLGLTGRLRIGVGSQILSELAYPPFALVFAPNSMASAFVGSINHFSDFGYDECREVVVRTVCGEGHTPYPYDYRTKDQVESDACRDREVAREMGVEYTQRKR